MKVTEIISETAKDEHRLQLIAKYIVRKIKNEVAQEEKYRAQDAKRGLKPEPPFLELGALKDNIPTKALSDLFGRLGRIKLDVNFGKEIKGAAGWFDNETNTIEINYPFGAEKELEKIESVIVHELRHALDNSKSRGWALHATPKSKAGAEHPLNKAASSDEFGYDYFAEPAEINARFSQVLQELTGIIKKDMRSGGNLTINNVMAQIHELLQKHELVSVFPSKKAIAGGTPEGKPLDNKDYQQILKRAIKYFDAEKERLTRNKK